MVTFYYYGNKDVRDLFNLIFQPQFYDHFHHISGSKSVMNFIFTLNVEAPTPANFTILPRSFLFILDLQD